MSARETHRHALSMQAAPTLWAASIALAVLASLEMGCIATVSGAELLLHVSLYVLLDCRHQRVSGGPIAM